MDWQSLFFFLKDMQMLCGCVVVLIFTLAVFAVNIWVWLDRRK